MISKPGMEDDIIQSHKLTSLPKCKVDFALEAPAHGVRNITQISGECTLTCVGYLNVAFSTALK
jgi:hypothetical protein